MNVDSTEGSIKPVQVTEQERKAVRKIDHHGTRGSLYTHSHSLGERIPLQIVLQRRKYQYCAWLSWSKHKSTASLDSQGTVG